MVVHSLCSIQKILPFIKYRSQNTDEPSREHLICYIFLKHKLMFGNMLRNAEKMEMLHNVSTESNVDLVFHFTRSWSYKCNLLSSSTYSLDFRRIKNFRNRLIFDSSYRTDPCCSKSWQWLSSNTRWIFVVRLWTLEWKWSSLSQWWWRTRPP